ncbi:MAG: response regulator, partial [Pseudomonadota bacterium]|nr:response regulator [Pseudomonadota bacterium]
TLAGVLHKPVTPSTLRGRLVQARREVDRPTPAGSPRPAAAEPLAQVARQRLAGARVLLVEDHPLNQQLACELLRRAGVDVEVAKDGQEALHRLAVDGPFDGVLMDCQMPVMDGYTATRELRRRPEWAHLPVIAMTASALSEDRDKALASGMNAHITKPIHLESMLQTMATWIAGPGQASPVALPAAPEGPVVAPSAPATLERSVGVAYCMGNEVLYRRVIEGFRDNESGIVQDIEVALAAGQWPTAQRRAHDLKGLSAMIGAPGLSAASATLYAALAARDLAATRTALGGFATELHRVLSAIELLTAHE